jgi:hypothetical protein
VSDKLPLAVKVPLGYHIHGQATSGEASKGRRGTMFSMFPLLAVSLILYGIATLAGGQGWVGSELVTLVMVSGNEWRIAYGDAYLMLSLIFLFVEILRSTKTGTDSLLNHALSAVLFVVSLLLFILIDGFGNSVFFIFTMMTALDFMAGFIVTTVSARRDFGLTGAG